MTELTALTALPEGELTFEEATFHGIPVEDLIYGRHDQHLYNLMEAEPQADGFCQESYMGYVIPQGRKGGFFVVGYDLNRGGGYHKVTLDKKGDILKVTTEAFSRTRFYDDLYDRLKAEYPTILDLRLD